MTEDKHTAALARIDERTAWICDTLKRHRRCYDDHDERLRELEVESQRSQGEQQGLDRGMTIQAASAGGISGSILTILVAKVVEWLSIGGRL